MKRSSKNKPIRHIDLKAIKDPSFLRDLNYKELDVLSEDIKNLGNSLSQRGRPVLVYKLNNDGVLVKYHSFEPSKEVKQTNHFEKKSHHVETIRKPKVEVKKEVKSHKINEKQIKVVKDLDLKLSATIPNPTASAELIKVWCQLQLENLSKLTIEDKKSFKLLVSEEKIKSILNKKDEKKQPKAKKAAPKSKKVTKEAPKKKTVAKKSSTKTAPKAKKPSSKKNPKTVAKKKTNKK